MAVTKQPKKQESFINLVIRERCFIKEELINPKWQLAPETGMIQSALGLFLRNRRLGLLMGKNWILSAVRRSRWEGKEGPRSLTLWSSILLPPPPTM